MFYVKAELAEGISINVDITDENVFNICPVCGAECQVDLVGVIKDGEDFDLYGSAIYCQECTQKKLHREENEGREVSPWQKTKLPAPEGRTEEEVKRMNPDIDYLERSIKRLVEELKKNNCLSQDFEFLTKTERVQKVESFIDDFIQSETHR